MLRAIERGAAGSWPMVMGTAALLRCHRGGNETNLDCRYADPGSAISLAGFLARSYLVAVMFDLAYDRGMPLHAILAREYFGLAREYFGARTYGYGAWRSDDGFGLHSA